MDLTLTCKSFYALIPKSILQLGMIKFVSILDLLFNISYLHCLLNMQVDKLKVLAESLANSASKAEKRISDHRLLAILVL